MTESSRLRFYATSEHDCSYLPGQRATTLFLDPERALEQKICTALSELGFRRSGSHLYRPHCELCNACIPARIPVARFQPGRQQRKIIRRNQDLQVQAVRPVFSEEHYRLYSRYIEYRHADGDMYPPSREQYSAFLVQDLPFTWFYEFRLDGLLLALAVTDRLDNGLSAVYTFFEPEETRRSLGRFAILWQIQECRRLTLDSLYLGYWIKNCRKMNYKTHYRPVELFIDQQQWVLLS